MKSKRYSFNWTSWTLTSWISPWPCQKKRRNPDLKRGLLKLHLNATPFLPPTMLWALKIGDAKSQEVVGLISEFLLNSLWQGQLGPGGFRKWAGSRLCYPACALLKVAKNQTSSRVYFFLLSQWGKSGATYYWKLTVQKFLQWKETFFRDISKETYGVIDGSGSIRTSTKQYF